MSLTSQINLIWGSHVMDPKTGVIFNDEQGWLFGAGSIGPLLTCSDDFAIPGAADAFGLLPSPWNYPAPGKK
jgi:gamma-glutamyltranspeptidase/glutathione hydrolase/leukotriene-C4 hydrolase